MAGPIIGLRVVHIILGGALLAVAGVLMAVHLCMTANQWWRRS